MSTGAEATIAADWINDALTAAVTDPTVVPGGIWDGEAAHDTPYPLIRFGAQSPGVEVRGNSTTTIMLNSLWLVRGMVDRNSYELLTPIEALIYGALHGVTQHTVSGGMIVSCVREDAFRLESVQGGRQYRSLGGIYRVQSQT